MAQNLAVAAGVRRYTRTDFAALRAWLSKIPAWKIMETFYSESDLIDRGCDTPGNMQQWLTEMTDHLVDRVSLVSPHLSLQLSQARAKNVWSPAAIQFLIQASDKNLSQPKLEDPLSVWFKPRVVKVFKFVGLATVGDLKKFIELRDEVWWKSVPRIGAGKAATLVKWFSFNEESLGQLKLKPPALRVDGKVQLMPGVFQAIPLERMVLPPSLNGSNGKNRNKEYCQISAKDDLEAAKAYLGLFADRPKSLRAYQKEVERFLLWCICERKTELSSVFTQDCEAYKRFLVSPPLAWCGVKGSKSSSAWRPFVGVLSPSSQRYAIQALRSFFQWLVNVRYLGGNPWMTVKDPVVAVKEIPLDLEKALSASLWDRLIEPGGVLDQACAESMSQPSQAKGGVALEAKASRRRRASPAQYRLARAAIFLVGSTGLRREEAAFASREHLKPVTAASFEGSGLWQLAVLGKRQKWRTVFIPQRVIEAIQAHWLDRGHDFSNASSDMALLSPVAIHPAEWVRRKHLVSPDEPGTLSGSGFSADGLYRVVKKALQDIAADDRLQLDDQDRAQLRRTSTHALRHTFASLAVAKSMPADVVQKLMGHASLATTSIYVQAEKSRVIEEVLKALER